MALPNKFTNTPQIKIDPKPGNRSLKNIVLDYLSMRERFRDHTNLQQLKYALIKDGVHVIDADFVKVFEEFQTMGAGELIKGKIPAFKWFYKLNVFAKAARAGLPIPEEAKLIKREKRYGVKGRPKGSLNKTTLAKLKVKPEPETATFLEQPVMPPSVTVPQQLTPAQILERHKLRQQPIVMPEMGSPTLMLSVPTNIKASDLQALVEMIEAIKASS